MPKEQKWTLDDLRAIVAAGLAVTEAKALLDEGYDAAAVLELAELQASQRTQAASDAQLVTAKAMQKAMKPENDTHPDISCFTHPDHPKGDLPFQCFYNGYPCHMFPETEHWREWELMKQLTPGEYTVLRKDLSLMAVSVKGERDANQKLTKVEVIFPISRAEKELVPAKTVLLYQLVHDGPPKKKFLKAMNEYMQILIGEGVEA